MNHAKDLLCQRDEGVTSASLVRAIQDGAPSQSGGEHTPGPWKFEDWDRHTLCVYAPWSDKVHAGSASGYGDYRGIYIAKVEHQNENECVSKVQAEANARLIAAAPDLLEALTAILSEPDLSNVQNAYLVQAFAAVAKARGLASCDGNPLGEDAQRLSAEHASTAGEAGTPVPLSQSPTVSDLVEAVCHADQMTVWSGDFIGALGMGDFLREGMSYDEGLDLVATIEREIRRVVESALDHPEAKASLLTELNTVKGERDNWKERWLKAEADCEHWSKDYAERGDTIASLRSRIEELRRAVNPLPERMTAVAWACARIGMSEQLKPHASHVEDLFSMRDCLNHHARELRSTLQEPGHAD